MYILDLDITNKEYKLHDTLTRKRGKWTNFEYWLSTDMIDDDDLSDLTTLNGLHEYYSKYFNLLEIVTIPIDKPNGKIEDIFNSKTYPEYFI